MLLLDREVPADVAVQMLSYIMVIALEPEMVRLELKAELEE